ncbi:hypothetical protein [Deinococcus cavernae]|uniref:hypothetical protein n=1 Tax=Deinococcus cavernae TaxID=2320857 RepID=UPI001314EE4E|nr:hypothetical protein [Deinococcus cavernae]
MICWMETTKIFEENRLFQARKDDIEEAISAPGTKVVLVFVHMGEVIKDHALRVLEDFCREEEVSFLDINGQLIHAALLADENPKEIKAKADPAVSPGHGYDAQGGLWVDQRSATGCPLPRTRGFAVRSEHPQLSGPQHPEQGD